MPNVSTNSIKAEFLNLAFEYETILIADENNPFILNSGKKSYVYFDMRTALRGAEFRKKCGITLAQTLQQDGYANLDDIQHIIGTPIGACNPAQELANTWQETLGRKTEPLLTTIRSKPKTHGNTGDKNWLVGQPAQQETALVVEDTVTTGNSVFDVIDTLQNKAEMSVKVVLVMFDRSLGHVPEEMLARGIHFVSVFTLADILQPELLAKEEKLFTST